MLAPSLHAILFPGQLQANNVYKITKKWYIGTYLYHTLFIPVPSTWTASIDTGFVSTWPGLISQLIRHHLPKSIATNRGHVRTALSNQRLKNPTLIPSIVPHTLPPVTITNPPTQGLVPENECYLRTVKITGKASSNQTGRFTYLSSCGTKYIMVLHDYESNAILAAPLKK